MNELTESLSTRLVPVAALIAYKKESSTNGNEYFVEARKINEEGLMGEAMPVSYALINDLTENFSQQHAELPFGEIPPNLIYADTRRGRERYVWYNTPRRRMMYFHTNLSIENAEYNMPSILYVAENGHLRVYTFKDKKIHSDSVLFCGPFFNVSSSNGSVCLGSAKLAKPSNPSYSEMLEYWEKKFWLTEFTHLGGGNNPTVENLVLVIKECRERPFPLHKLKPANLKLKDLLK